ncbi:uncharacterized protein Dwil_GK20464 [Drosophila willistoni]|uniref:uncharacterized protein LOC6645930 n=1 Tax=Drosophila willistoni TaxID=7260 RepID=UPI00073276F3|nr:uncharacterized protein LOC6645930 [Drosophila willistoni]EDW79413.2 uncharacterized protein Dwil_GK20464 [Drosophila willistoni]
MNNQLTPATFRKFNNLLNSGAVTVTGPSQPRILKTRLVVQSGGGGGGGGGSVSSGAGGGVSSNVQQNVSDLDTTGGQGTRCYICDERCEPSTALTEMCTTHTSTKFPNKLAQLVGEGFLVIVCGEDYVCSRCTNLVNYYDRLENDVERVKTNLISLLNKKYAINEDVGLEAGPPMKMQKLTAGAGNRSIEDSPGGDLLRTRKVAQTTSGQLKTSSQPATTQAGSQQVQRKATKIYKCTSCDYKTSDMRLFNTHYESCKQQTFQCKTCRRIFPHFGAMKQHMVRDHNTAMDNTCAMCHINFVNDTSLRKHMETNHATNVLVTSTTTIPAAAAPVQAAANAAAAAAASNESSSLGGGSALYTCNHCQFKSTDKGIFDEHMRKHMTGAKPKPFKCRLCSQRFETRDAATIHAKQHQTNYFKCGTCAMTFPKRDLLVKHFEVHQNSGSTAAVSPKPNLNTQKLLQETIDEALSDTVPASGGGGAAAAAAAVVASAEAENNIRFFSCSICSLTFIQETYYNQHMETHRRDNKKAGSTAGGNTALNSAATALLSDEPSEATGKAAGEEAGVEHSEADIESLFEKLHSEKADSGEAAASKTSKSGEMVITSQAGSGGITFNITIPQPTDGEQNQKDSPDAPVSVSIDMPVLDQAEEESSQQSAKIAEVESEVANNEGKSQNAAAAPVSMPSLDDDNEASAAAVTDSESAKAGAGGGSKASNEKSAAPKSVDVKVESESTAKETVTQSAADEGIKVEATADSAVAGDVAESAETSQGEEVGGAAVEGEAAAAGGEQQVAMELDEAMQAQVDGGQIKFIVNENGHLLQLDNHILTDAEGNQIIVQDPEQIQQLLQSVGVLQSGEGLEGETLQMMTDGSGQMVLVHGDNNEQQLIDASLLNAEGQLIIQQGQDGEEGPHVISEDGTRIPVSVSYTEDGQPIVQVQQQVLEAAQAAQAEEKEAAAAAAAGEPTGQEEAQVSEASGAGTAATTTTAAATSAGGAVTTTTVAATSSSSGRASGGSFFALEEFTESKTD